MESFDRSVGFGTPRRRPSARTGRRVLALVPALALVGAACSDGGPGPTGPGGGGGGGGPLSYDHGRAPGASAADFLRADDFDRLRLQVQYVEGFRPSDAGLEHLRDFLEARLDKPNGVTIEIGAPLQIQAQATYSAADVRALEETHRTTFTDDGTLAAYLLFLDGEYAGGANVLGIAYNNTSMAIFQEKIEDNTGAALQPAQDIVEGAVTAHEIGHLLGLVDNGSPMQTPHRDTAHGQHCDDQQCLMYYQVRTTDFLAQLLGSPVPSLDPDCLADLQANGGK